MYYLIGFILFIIVMVIAHKNNAMNDEDPFANAVMAFLIFMVCMVWPAVLSVTALFAAFMLFNKLMAKVLKK